MTRSGRTSPRIGDAIHAEEVLVDPSSAEFRTFVIPERVRTSSAFVVKSMRKKRIFDLSCEPGHNKQM